MFCTSKVDVLGRAYVIWSRNCAHDFPVNDRFILSRSDFKLMYTAGWSFIPVIALCKYEYTIYIICIPHKATIFPICAFWRIIFNRKLSGFFAIFPYQFQNFQTRLINSVLNNGCMRTNPNYSYQSVTEGTLKINLKLKPLLITIFIHSWHIYWQIMR